MARAGRRRDFDESMALRAAWLHYGGGLTQAEVAARLDISTVKAHRLIAWANQSGAVKVSIDGDVAECVALETRLSEEFGLTHCEVVPDLGERGMPLRALGIAGARFIRQEIESERSDVIGVGHGRTLASAVDALPRITANGVRFVSLMGGLTRNYAANPHDVIHRLAEKTGASAYVMPIPFFANTAADREVFLAQRGVSQVIDLAARSDLMLVGIGTANPGAQLVASHMIDVAEIGEVQERGGAGEVLGHFFDRDGQLVETSLSARTVSLDIRALGKRRIVAIAGGEEKLNAMAAVLRSGTISGLITDEATATALADGRVG